jgi:Lrp/AsnC family transcriptional regulator
MDRKDQRILTLLQTNAGLTMTELADKVSLSVTACWKRVQRLSEQGYMRQQVWLLDNKKVGLGVTVFVSIKTNRHDLEWLRKFAAGVRDMPEVMEFYRMSGDTDYLLKVVVPDIAGFDRVYKKLIQVVELFDVSSAFAMEEIKYTTALPLDYAE